MTPGDVFVDWLSIAQEHPAGGLPLVDAGCVLGCDAEGDVEWKAVRAVQHKGSHETTVNVRCDGHRVSFSGNVSRFGRRDNLFGFGFDECLRRVNAILGCYQLPPFTPGVTRSDWRDGRLHREWTGARISRIDLTRNYVAGTADDAHAVLQWLGSQHAGRKTGRVLGQGETVDFGGTGNGKDGTKGSRREYWKAYIKWLEMLRHGADEKVMEWAKAVGIVRFEGTVRTTKLIDLGASFLGEFQRGRAMGKLIRLFNERAEVLGRAKRTTDELDELPRALRGTARDYLAGMDVKRAMSRTTFYRKRLSLLPYGIDISVRNVKPFSPRVRVVELRAAQMPEWYQLAA
jgi:hypothetical protein